MTRRSTVLAVPLVLVAGCSGSSTPKDHGTVTAAGAPEAQTAEVGARDTLFFSPNVVKAKVGSLRLTVRNAGGVPHNLVFDDGRLPHTGTIDGHASAVLSLRFERSGAFTFTCTFHPGMTGRVVVAP